LISRLRKITDGPVSGSYFSSTSTVLYIDRGTGHIYEYSDYSKSSVKITSTIIPRIHDSYWLSKSSFVARYLDTDNETIKTFIGTINNPGENGSVITEFLPHNIKSVAVSPKNDKFAYLYKDGQNSQIVLRDIKTKKETGIAILPGYEYKMYWNENGLFAVTNTTFELPGYIMKISLTGGDPEILIGPISGLSAKPIKTGFIISSFRSKNESYIYNSKNRKYESVVQTLLPEKCVELGEFIYCAASEMYNVKDFPDIWYRGEISPVDSIIKIKTSDGVEISLEHTSVLSNVVFDMIDIKTSPDKKTFLFTDKKTGGLWSVDLL